MMWRRLKRILKHRWLDVSDTRRAISPEGLERLTRHVAASESLHSGELRILVEAGLPMSYVLRDAPARERAVMQFGKLRVWDTEHNNGVLIYLLLADRAIELVADRGLNQHVSPVQWQAMAQRLSAAIGRGQFELGLTQAIDELSAIMVAHFPLVAGMPNANELPDQPQLS